MDGVVEAVNGTSMRVRTKDRTITVNLEAYGHVDHGYARTLHKGQGATAERVHVGLSNTLDRQLAYVGLSRHRERVRAYWTPETAKDKEALFDTLCRDRRKDMALDYIEERGIEPASEHVMRHAVETLMEEEERFVPAHEPTEAEQGEAVRQLHEEEKARVADAPAVQSDPEPENVEAVAPRLSMHQVELSSEQSTGPDFREMEQRRQQEEQQRRKYEAQQADRERKEQEQARRQDAIRASREREYQEIDTVNYLPHKTELGLVRARALISAQSSVAVYRKLVEDAEAKLQKALENEKRARRSVLGRKLKIEEAAYYVRDAEGDLKKYEASHKSALEKLREEEATQKRDKARAEATGHTLETVRAYNESRGRVFLAERVEESFRAYEEEKKIFADWGKPRDSLKDREATLVRWLNDVRDRCGLNPPELRDKPRLLDLLAKEEAGVERYLESEREKRYAEFMREREMERRLERMRQEGLEWERAQRRPSRRNDGPSRGR